MSDQQPVRTFPNSLQCKTEWEPERWEGAYCIHNCLTCNICLPLHLSQLTLTQIQAGIYWHSLCMQGANRLLSWTEGCLRDFGHCRYKMRTALDFSLLLKDERWKRNPRSSSCGKAPLSSLVSTMPSSLGDLRCLPGDLRSKVSQDQWRSSSAAWPGSFGGRWPCFCFPAGVNNTGAMEQEWILLEPKVF